MWIMMISFDMILYYIWVKYLNLSFWSTHSTKQSCSSLLNEDLRLKVHFASLPQQQWAVTAVPCRCAPVAHCLFPNPAVLPLHPPAHPAQCQSRRRRSEGTSFVSTTMSTSNRSNSLPCATPPARLKQGWVMLLFCFVWFLWDIFHHSWKSLRTRLFFFKSLQKVV